MNCTAQLSSISDWLCSTLVAQSLKRYSSITYTPDYFIEMLFWVEDKRFPVHLGVDPIAIARAIVFNLTGGTKQGASTISQQVYTIRLSRRGRIARSLSYKIK